MTNIRMRQLGLVVLAAFLTVGALDAQDPYAKHKKLEATQGNSMSMTVIPWRPCSILCLTFTI